MHSIDQKGGGGLGLGGTLISVMVWQDVAIFFVTLTSLIIAPCLPMTASYNFRRKFNFYDGLTGRCHLFCNSYLLDHSPLSTNDSPYSFRRNFNFYDGLTRRRHFIFSFFFLIIFCLKKIFCQKKKKKSDLIVSVFTTCVVDCRINPKSC